VPLRAGVQNPKNRFQNIPGWNRLAARAPLGDALFRKAVPNAFLMLVA